MLPEERERHIYYNLIDHITYIDTAITKDFLKYSQYCILDNVTFLRPPKYKEFNYVNAPGKGFEVVECQFSYPEDIVTIKQKRYLPEEYRGALSDRFKKSRQ